MSANLDLVRSILTTWERGDYSSADWADPEIEYAMVDGPERGHWEGLAAMAEAARKGLDAWKDVPALRSRSTASWTMSECSCSTTSVGAARRAVLSSGECERTERTCSISAAAR
jgi:hypothetical protein